MFFPILRLRVPLIRAGATWSVRVLPFLYKLLYFLYYISNFDLLDTPLEYTKVIASCLGSLLVSVVLLSRRSSENLRTSGVRLDA